MCERLARFKMVCMTGHATALKPDTEKFGLQMIPEEIQMIRVFD
jgi:hypothetical protein